MKAPEYEISTMQDILDCVTAENIDRFMIDFRNYLDSAILVKIFSSLKGEKIVNKGFTWIDDSKNDCKTTLKP